MAQSREVIPVMDEKGTPRPRSGKAGSKGATGARKDLGGQYSTSFTKKKTHGLTFERR